MGISTDNRYDAIVIGAGLGGLSCALHLAKKGMHVVVLEKQPKVGGYCQNYLRGDYNFDVSLHVLPAMSKGQGMYRLLDYLQVLDKLEVIERDPMYSCGFEDKTYRLPGRGNIAARDYLKACFPNERAGLDRFFETIERLVTANTELFWTGKVDFTSFFPARYYGKTYRQLLAEHVTTARLHGILGQLWQSAGLPNSRCAANWAAEINGWHLLSGNFYIRGGGQQLSFSLTDNLRAAGSVVQVSSLVRRVLHENRQVTGVELENGEVFRAPIVVSNASPLKTLFSLIGEDQLSAPYVQRLKNMETSCSLLTVYLGLDCPAEHVGVEGHTLFINYDDENERTYQLALKEAYDQTDFVISNYTDDTTGYHPRGCGIVQVAEIAPGRPWIHIPRAAYEEKKKKVLDILLEKTFRHYPDLKKHIRVSELATPRTMSLATGNPMGSVYGFAQTPDQADNSRFGAQSSFKGLYFAGAWCRGGGGGYMGSVINGRVAARQILKREGLYEKEDVPIAVFPMPAPRRNEPSDEGDAARSRIPPKTYTFTVEKAQISPHGELTEAAVADMASKAANRCMNDNARRLQHRWPETRGPAALHAAFVRVELALVPQVEVACGDTVQVQVTVTPKEPARVELALIATRAVDKQKLFNATGLMLVRSLG